MTAPERPAWLVQALADDTTRAAVVSELRRLALVAEHAGDRAQNSGRWQTAIANYQTSAQRGRAAMALANGTGYDPRDTAHVEQAAAQVRSRAALAAARGGAR